MDMYEINLNTVALIPIEENKTMIFEKNDSFVVNLSCMKIIERSCEYFGSSYIGRHEGTKKLTGISHKSPIIIEESRDIIYFPTTSPRLQECVWLSLKHINNYYSKNGKSIVDFENGQTLEVDISYESLDNQYLRATKLESILRKRKSI